tara:strand:- start:1606 stop:2391 length:786 start_codon:yes stop_codon:yes gene_type:complete
MKKYISTFIILLASISFVLFTSQKCSEPQKELTESSIYPSNPVDFSQSILLYIKSELPYKQYLDTLQQINLKKLHTELDNPDKKLAFWINIYNSLVQIRLLENPNLFKDKNAFFKKNDILVGGEKLSLNDIENGIMRLKTDESISNLFITKKFMLKTLENRIHFTLNCGATSCPAIAYYNPEELDQQLEEATLFYVENNCEYNAEKNEVVISELFSWFKDDFNGEDGVVEFLKKYKLIPKDKFPSILFKKYDWGVKPGNFN